MALLCLVLLASPAPAAQTHFLESSFGAGELSDPQGVAVDNSTGDVYVASAGASEVRKYAPSGAPSNFSALGTNALGPFAMEGLGYVQVAVDNSGGVNSGNVYIPTKSGIRAFKPSGQPADFSASAPYIDGNTITHQENVQAACGLAIGPDGTIFVGRFLGGVDAYAPSGEYLLNVGSDWTCNVAVDSVGTVYRGGAFGGITRQTPDALPVTASTTYSSAVEVPGVEGKTPGVDPGNDNLYTESSGGFSTRWDSAANGNARIADFGPEGHGFAVDRSGGVNEGSVYLTAGGEVKRFGPSRTVADLSVEPATGVTSTAATLNGVIGAAGGTAADCELQYVSEADFNSNGFAGAVTLPCSPPGPFTGTGTQAVSAGLSNLDPETTYRFRLRSTNAYGTIASASQAFETATAVKAVGIAAATNVTTSSATLNGTIDPGGQALTDCKFEYGPTDALALSVPCAESPGSIGSGEGPVPVHADVNGLGAGIYRFRLVATNAIGSTRSSTETLVVRGVPAVIFQSASSEPFRAVLRARINPGNEATTYRFEYGLTPSYGSSTAEETIAAGNDPVLVAQQVVGLEPGTTYHYRVVAVNALGQVAGPDKTFTTDVAPGAPACSNTPLRAEQGSTYLPECRAYEQVSPRNKLGKNVYNPGITGEGFLYDYPTAVAPDGSRASFQAQGGFADASSSAPLTTYVASRGAQGWGTHAVTSNRYTGSVAGKDLNVKRWSLDLKGSVIAVNDAGESLAPGGTPEQWNLLSHDFGTGGYQMLTADPVGAPFPLDQFFSVGGSSDDLSTVAYLTTAPRTADAPITGVRSVYAWRNGKLELASVLPDPDGAGSLVGGPAPDGASMGGRNPVSDDGSRLFFSTPDERVYAREVGVQTIEVSASRKAIPDSHQPAEFHAATPDGRYAFFSTEEQLLDSDTDAQRDLYRLDLDTDSLIRIGGEGVIRFLGASDDGSFVYLATGALSTMLWHNGQVEKVADGFSISAQSFQVTPDGTAAAFESSDPQMPTGEDLAPAGQIYLYDATTDTLRCVSCRPDGKEPSGRIVLPYPASLPASVEESQLNVEINVLSDDGERVFFTTRDPLVAADINEKSDAYEYVNGRQYLISSGKSDLNSFVLNATPSGSDVFFTTLEPLVRYDGDQNIDLYTARTGGGFPEPPPQVPCAGEACKSTPTSPPPPTRAGSAQFSGPGNASPRAGKKAKKKHKKKARKKGKKRAGKSKGASKRSAGK